MNPDEEITISAIAVDIESCAKALRDGTERNISDNLYSIAKRLYNLTRNKKTEDNGISINGKDGRDFNEQFALESMYAMAVGCLKDALFVCNEREYYGVNTLVLQALTELTKIGELTKIDGARDARSAK